MYNVVFKPRTETLGVPYEGKEERLVRRAVCSLSALNLEVGILQNSAQERDFRESQPSAIRTFPNHTYKVLPAFYKFLSVSDKIR